MVIGENRDLMPSSQKTSYEHVVVRGNPPTFATSYMQCYFHNFLSFIMSATHLQPVDMYSNNIDFRPQKFQINLTTAENTIKETFY